MDLSGLQWIRLNWSGIEGNRVHTYIYTYIFLIGLSRMAYESPLTISLKKTKAKIQKAIYNIVKGLKVARNSFVARAAWANLAILYPRKFCKIFISIKNISES